MRPPVVVPAAGLEPTLHKATDFKSDASTNSAMRALEIQKVQKIPVYTRFTHTHRYKKTWAGSQGPMVLVSPARCP